MKRVVLRGAKLIKRQSRNRSSARFASDSIKKAKAEQVAGWGQIWLFPQTVKTCVNAAAVSSICSLQSLESQVAEISNSGERLIKLARSVIARAAKAASGRSKRQIRVLNDTLSSAIKDFEALTAQLPRSNTTC